MSQAQGIVTPEAVVLELETAGVGSRLVAGGIDAVIRGALLFGLLVGSAFVGQVASSIGLAGVFISVFVVLLGYPVLFETLWHGKTPGKAMLGLRVVTVEGSPIRFRHAAIRGILGFVDIYLTSGSVGVLSILFTARNQRLGDLVAGTIVLRERTGAAAPTAVTFTVPWGYESYASSLDVSGLTAAEYGAARSFLLRAATLQPAQRAELARQLAVPLATHLRHTPPSWVVPEAFLACVVAVYQQRQRWGAPWTAYGTTAPPPPPPPPPAPGGPAAPPAGATPPPEPSPGSSGGFVPPS